MKFKEFPSTDEVSINDTITVTDDASQNGLSECSAAWLVKSIDARIGLPLSYIRNTKTAWIPHEFNEDFINDIRDGNFSNIGIGDVIEADGILWRILDINYWCGKEQIQNEPMPNHLIVMPTCTVGSIRLHATSKPSLDYVSENDYNLSGPQVQFSYAKSKAFHYLNTDFKDYINRIFLGHVIPHDEYFPDYNLARYNAPSGSWHKVYASIGDEGMMIRNRNNSMITSVYTMTNGYAQTAYAYKWYTSMGYELTYDEFDGLFTNNIYISSFTDSDFSDTESPMTIVGGLSSDGYSINRTKNVDYILRNIKTSSDRPLDHLFPIFAIG